jgi:hypothetical protein
LVLGRALVEAKDGWARYIPFTWLGFGNILDSFWIGGLDETIDVQMELTKDQRWLGLAIFESARWMYIFP